MAVLVAVSAGWVYLMTDGSRADFRQRENSGVPGSTSSGCSPWGRFSWRSTSSFVFVISGFFDAALLRPRWLMATGVLATSLLIQAPIIGYPMVRPDLLALYVIVVTVQTLAITGGIVGTEWLSQLSEQRRLVVADLEAALDENAGLHAQLVSQAREAGILDERQRMAGEIHDTVAQGLAGVITNIEAALA